MNLQLQWTELKTVIIAKTLNLQYIETDQMYKLWAVDDAMIFTCNIDKNPSDLTDLNDFNNNFKANCNKKITDVDNQGRKVMRVAAGKAGWTFSSIPIEFTTSNSTGLYAKLVDGTNRSGVNIKFYNNSDQEITNYGLLDINLNACTKTVIEFEPPYDYEIIGGSVQQLMQPSTDVRLWVIAVPDISENNGGSKEMIGGINLKFIDPTDKVEADGRASKLMTFNATYHTNKLRLIIKHNAGVKHDLLLVLEMFRA